MKKLLFAMAYCLLWTSCASQPGEPEIFIEDERAAHIQALLLGTLGALTTCDLTDHV